MKLHSYADASSEAYSPAVYTRTIHQDSFDAGGLVSAKTQVEPLKLTTMPNQEFSRALLAARLLHSVAIDLELVFGEKSSTDMVCLVVIDWELPRL